MKDLVVRLSKTLLDNDIDARSYKRMEASLQSLNETGKDATDQQKIAFFLLPGRYVQTDKNGFLEFW